jgi:N-acetylglutamate synthase-like GNAT family acetyltransferase
MKDKNDRNLYVEFLLEEIKGKAKKAGIRPDWRGNYFSSKLLADLRELIELSGFEKAFIYIEGKMDRSKKRWEQVGMEIIENAMQNLKENHKFDMETKGYIIGKLNQLLNYKKEEKHERN